MPENDSSANKITPVESAKLTLDKFIDSANVDKVYGAPIKRGQVTIIPVAEVVNSMGFGIGGSTDGDGGGGGGYSNSRPVAVIIMSEDSVQVEPVMDVTKVALAFLTAIGFMFSTWRKMKKGK